MKRYILIIIFFIALYPNVLGQKGEEPNYFFETNYQYGFVWQHRPSIESILGGNINVLQLNIGKETYGQTYWDQLYRYPDWGAGFYCANLGNNEEMGVANAIYGYINIPLVLRKKFEVRYNISGGLAYLTKGNVAIGTHLNLYFDDRLYYSQKRKEAKYYEKISGVKGNLCENMQVFLDKSTTKLLIVEKNEAKLQEILYTLKKKYHDSLKIARSEKAYIDIMNKDVSKGNALRELADELNIKKDEIIAVGDNFNDFEMLNFAGLSLVMGNADKKLKKIADIVVGNNNELGAARGLKNILKLG